MPISHDAGGQARPAPSALRGDEPSTAPGSSFPGAAAEPRASGAGCGATRTNAPTREAESDGARVSPRPIPGTGEPKLREGTDAATSRYRRQAAAPDERTPAVGREGEQVPPGRSPFSFRPVPALTSGPPRYPPVRVSPLTSRPLPHRVPEEGEGDTDAQHREEGTEPQPHLPAGALARSPLGGCLLAQPPAPGQLPAGRVRAALTCPPPGPGDVPPTPRGPCPPRFPSRQI